MRPADRDGTSVRAVAVGELSDVSRRRADNPAPIGELPDLGVDVRAIVESVGQERADRFVRDASAALSGLLNAGYVALAEALGCPLVTADARISRASGIRGQAA